MTSITNDSAYHRTVGCMVTPLQGLVFSFPLYTGGGGIFLISTTLYYYPDPPQVSFYIDCRPEAGYTFAPCGDTLMHEPDNIQNLDIVDVINMFISYELI